MPDRKQRGQFEYLTAACLNSHSLMRGRLMFKFLSYQDKLYEVVLRGAL